jgi:hypothetical protein
VNCSNADLDRKQEEPQGRKPKFSKLAIASVSLGVLAFLVLYLRGLIIYPYRTRELLWNIVGLLGAIGLIFGVLGIERVLRPWERLKGGGFAILGILLGASIFHVWLIQRIYPRMVGYVAPVGSDIGQLSHAMRLYANDYKNQYPDPNQWCDLLLEHGHVKVEHFTWPSLIFRMPVSRERVTWPVPTKGRSRWAMNPNCRTSNSPMDMVLLFEAEEGWNRFGGQELATTEYHDGLGCRVILNDGRVTFLRPAKLKELNWTGQSDKDQPGKR